MSYKKMVLNLSMLGPAPTGLGVYSEHCAEVLERSFHSTIVTSYYQADPGATVVPSPREVAIGGGRFAAIRRLWYMTHQFPKDDAFVYSPTHHGVIGYDNQVITIHDLISVHHPRQHRFQYYYFTKLLPRIVKRCSAVFTVSETAKKDIAEYYAFPSEKIFVIPNGVDTNIFHPPTVGETALRDDESYLLVVGASYPHKNIEELLRQSALWRDRYILKIASCSGKEKARLQATVGELKLSDRVEFLGYVTTDTLVKLYQNCAALVFPSLWEGFGIPPLEAMASGRLAIISDIPVHREIFKDAAIYITPGREDSWSAAFAALDSASVVEDKISAGMDLVRRYSWKAAGEKLVGALLAVDPGLERFLKPTASI